MVLSGEAFDATMAVSGGVTTLAAYGRGTAHFLRDPRAAVRWLTLDEAVRALAT